MKAICADRPGGPEVLVYRDVPEPEPGDGEVLVKLSAIGVNYADIGRREGTYAGSAFPAVMGGEGTGDIVALGPGVEGFAVGETVSFRGPTTGSYAEYAAVPIRNAYKVPDDIAPEAAAALQVQGMTAYVLLNDIAPVRPGGACLVHAGAGGVGHVLIQLAKAQGLTVFTTVGSAEKAAIAKGFGADETIFYRTEDFAERIDRLTGGAGVDAVYDGVGPATLRGSIACTGFGGKVVVFGSPSEGSLTPDLRWLTPNAVSITFGRLSQFVRTTEDVKRVSDALVRMVRDGSLRLNIAPPHPLSEAASVHRALQGRETTGKLILLP